MATKLKHIKRMRIRKHLLSISKLCSYCGIECTNSSVTSLTYATIDHRIPKAKGGTNAKHNMILSCLKCNRDKGELSPEEYIKKLRELDGQSLKFHYSLDK